MKKQFRQGDLLFEEVSSVPPKAVRSESPVLAYGEVTGHSHCIKGTFDRFDIGSEIFVLSSSDCDVVHEEHNTITLDKGTTFRVTRQREYDPRTSIPRQVAD